MTSSAKRRRRIEGSVDRSGLSLCTVAMEGVCGLARYELFTPRILASVIQKPTAGFAEMISRY